MQSAPEKPAGLFDQACLVDEISRRCQTVNGQFSPSAMITLTEKEAEALQAIATRLYRIAPFEGRIRDIVTGKAR